MKSQAEQTQNHLEEEKRREENTSQLNLGTSITLILKWDNDSTTKRKLQNNILHETRCQIFKQNISKSNPTYKKTYIASTWILSQNAVVSAFENRCNPTY